MLSLEVLGDLEPNGLFDSNDPECDMLLWVSPANNFGGFGDLLRLESCEGMFESHYCGR